MSRKRARRALLFLLREYAAARADLREKQRRLDGWRDVLAVLGVEPPA